ncbi:MAG: RluA family pseudouridine synthase [Clostridiales bacterium]|nr:RluA family pseudouridine synthase [Clostridiales bacterium]
MTPSNGVKIIFEDNHVLVAYKPAGILSQEDSTGAPDMLTILKDHIKIRDNKPGNVWLGLLHRLDRPVSGVMVFAKTSKCASRISEQIRQRKVSKRYKAVVSGLFGEEEGSLENYILKDGKTNTVKVFDRAVPDAKKAKLGYRVLASADGLSLVEVELDTGRSHQIRAQMAKAGHPLIGDRKYGRGTDACDIALQSYLIGFSHPVSGEYMEFTIPAPEGYPWDLFS